MTFFTCVLLRVLYLLLCTLFIYFLFSKIIFVVAMVIAVVVRSVHHYDLGWIVYMAVAVDEVLYYQLVGSYRHDTYWG